MLIVRVSSDASYSKWRGVETSTMGEKKFAIPAKQGETVSTKMTELVSGSYEKFSPLQMN